MNMPTTVNISAIVVAYDRLDLTLFTLGKLERCTPVPEEILVHIDGNQNDLANRIREAYPQIDVWVNESNVGPGGGRNVLLRRAKHPVIASFDDDSYPVDADYFARLERLANDHPEADVFAASIRERGQVHDASDGSTPLWVADFVGCGCAYRKAFIEQVGGYVPLPVAYGMEEADLALRLHANGGRILFAPALRVFHDTDLSHHSSPGIAGGNIANAALLPFLRYPLYLMPVGIFQFARKVWDTARRKRITGLVRGLRLVVPHLIRNRRWRSPVDGRSVLSFLSLRRHPRIAHS
jgi:GT2 family glycosyltransferase